MKDGILHTSPVLFLPLEVTPLVLHQPLSKQNDVGFPVMNLRKLDVCRPPGKVIHCMNICSRVSTLAWTVLTRYLLLINQENLCDNLVVNFIIWLHHHWLEERRVSVKYTYLLACINCFSGRRIHWPELTKDAADLRPGLQVFIMSHPCPKRWYKYSWGQGSYISYIPAHGHCCRYSKEHVNLKFYRDGTCSIIRTWCTRFLSFS